MPATPFDLRLTAELALGADLARDARDLRRERAELLDHRVDDLGRAQELALERTRPSISSAMVCERSPLATAPMTRATSVVGCTRSAISVLTCSMRACHWPPAPPSDGALVDLALLADDLADARELLRRALLELDDVVERVGDLAGDAGVLDRQADGEVALLDGQQRREQQLVIDDVRRRRLFLLVAVAVAVVRSCACASDLLHWVAR